MYKQILPRKKFSRFLVEMSFKTTISFDDYFDFYR